MFGQQLRRALLGGLALGLAATSLMAPRADAADASLVGTFALTGGTCSGSKATGTYFRMVQPSGTVANGPWVSNADSSCASDKTFTLLSPGTDGGLVSGTYQPAPDPVFDASGNARAARITQPATFFGKKFGLSTDPTDLQTKKPVPAVSLSTDGSNLTGDVRAWAATWNNQYFNQGAPKPDDSKPGLTTAARGTYNPSTGAFVLEWASTIVGGPFNNFTGTWHLEGTFRAAGSAPAATSGSGAAAASGTKTAVAGNTQQNTATTVATADDASTTDEAGAATTDDTVQAIGKVDSKGWNPPAWLIVVTALAGVAAAASLLIPNRRTEA